MRINEDFIEQEDIIDNITDTDLSDENPYFIMQDRRPVGEILKDWNCIFYLEIGDYWAKEPNYVKQVEQMVNVYTRKLTDVFERLPYGIQMSKFVVGSGLNDGEFEHEDTEFSQYKTYLIKQTNDDNGIQKETKMFIGINLNQGTLNLQKAFIALTKISNIIFRITKLNEFMILYKCYSWYDAFRIFNSSTGRDDMKTRLETDISYAIDGDPNWRNSDPIHQWMNMLCNLCGHNHMETNYDYDDFIKEMNKFKEMLRKNF